MTPRRKTSLLLLASCLCLLSGAADLDALEAQYRETRKVIDLVSRAAELFEREGHEACAEFKRPDSEWLSGDVYVFVLDFGSNALCHPTLEGRNLAEFRDADGRPIMELMLRQLRGGGSEGWVHYLWPRPGQTVQGWKSTYLRRATCPEHDEDVIVAAGAYGLQLEKIFVVDRVEEAARLLAREGEAAFDTLRAKAGGFIFFDAYVFVMSWEGTMLAHPFSPELEGKSVLNVRDPDGVYPGRQMLAALEDAGAAWVEYFWPRPGGGEAIFKETYVKKVETDAGVLVVGSGVYLD